LSKSSAEQVFCLESKTMKAILTAHNLASDLVTSIWTPVFVGIFLVIVTYALWPRNQAAFDEASKMPLRED
jgi:cytochrome c oxidase cbb3-type subunit IV